MITLNDLKNLRDAHNRRNAGTEMPWHNYIIEQFRSIDLLEHVIGLMEQSVDPYALRDVYNNEELERLRTVEAIATGLADVYYNGHQAMLTLVDMKPMMDQLRAMMVKR